mmetsp:Transcript_37342/g.91525  ORF Transcript_37342/g.91525 Transcript_37342/m.91525 type:complete len:220 (-) Transcript_37342:194-853(-)
MCGAGAAAREALVVGVLELQGDFAEHTAMLRRCGVETRAVRLPEDLEGLDGLVVPGGESTTIGKLLVELGMMDRLRRAVDDGLPVFGTCAGCILMATDIVKYPEQPRIGAIDMQVDRNAYGRQIDSFETEVRPVAGVNVFKGAPLRAVLIRAPSILTVGEGVEVLAQLNDRPIVVKQGNCVATTFHPELTTDTRMHELFLSVITQRSIQCATESLSLRD